VASFAGIAVLGAWLTWKKGSALLALVRAPAPAAAFAMAGGASSRFVCEAVETDPGHVHDENCRHFHMPDPRTLGDNFSWKETAVTVFTAGARPCSGALIVLVFALAQGILYAGVLATLAMGLGTAITTSALATLAVFAKRVALKFSGESSRRGEIVGRGLEFLAACVVLCLGVLLTLGYSMAGF
jgi:ABC-type nickel/cobalt efflux system permease component RcnA